MEVEGKPKTVKWLRDGRLVDWDLIGAYVEVCGNEKYRLTISELCDDNDFAQYTVQLSNDLGSVESSANVKEKSKNYKHTFLHQI